MNNRGQVFRKDGTFIKEFYLRPETRGNGAEWDVDFSADTRQTHLFSADGENNVVWIQLHDTGSVLGRFGRNGRYAGQFHWVHNLVVDSKGIVYTAEGRQRDAGPEVQAGRVRSDGLALAGRVVGRRGGPAEPDRPS